MMAQPTEIRSDALRPLAALAVIQQGPAAYYFRLRESRDEILEAGAWCALIDGRHIPYVLWDDAIAACRFASVRRRAFDFFRSIMRDDLARRAAVQVAASQTDAEQQLMLADLDFDAERAAAAEGQIYLATGDIAALGRASEKADAAGGWRESLVWAVRAAAIAPLNPLPLQRLYSVLEMSAQPDLLVELANLYIGRKMHLQVAQIFLARAALMQKNPELCLKRLAPFDDAKVSANPVLSPYLNAIRALRAECEERLGHFRKAYEAYVALNAAERDKAIDPNHYLKGIEVRSRLNIPDDLPPARATPVTQMLGFPRSGTTLLENVLAAHPAVETFEEIPAFQTTIDRIERVLLGRAAAEEPRLTFIGARDTYYHEIERRRRKVGATTLIDKMPIRTAEADFVTRLFPEWRYIFAIRHPYDVVLSCFKQRFTPNPAMENFRSIEGSVRLYDFAMTEWFKRFTLDDPRVTYVRYDQLVTDFEATTRMVLDFLGLDWAESVVNFAEAADKRAANTPSYQKVRSGLSIGVQTYWRDYRFLFEGEVGTRMRKWADFFGFETD